MSRNDQWKKIWAEMTSNEEKKYLAVQKNWLEAHNECCAHKSSWLLTVSLQLHFAPLVISAHICYATSHFLSVMPIVSCSQICHFSDSQLCIVNHLRNQPLLALWAICLVQMPTSRVQYLQYFWANGKTCFVVVLYLCVKYIANKNKWVAIPFK